MVQNLTMNNILSTPFSLEAFRLFIRTNRAISLFAILKVKLMTIFAVRSKRIFSTNTVRVNEGVLSNSDYSKVRYIDTASILTNMVYNHASRYVTLMNKIRYSMRSTIKLTKEKYSVSIFIKWRLPKMTTIIFNPFTVKSFEFLIGYIHTPIIPCLPFIKQGESNG